MTDEELCRLCGKDPNEHIKLVNEGVINHHFSYDGSVTQVERGQKARVKRQEVMVVPGVDIALRQLLIEKGVLSESDFVDAGAITGLPPRDLRDRAVQGSDGGMRPADPGRGSGTAEPESPAP